jgi:hypothetical protein
MANHSLGGARYEDIYVIGLDNLWQSLGERQVHGVKIDVQGMELSVLAGMSQVLAEQRPKLAVEFHAGVDRNAILELLRRSGYQLPARPIEPQPGEVDAEYHDSHTYVFYNEGH